MGLTIHYKMRLPSGHERGPEWVLNELRKYAARLKPASLSKVKHFAGSECDYTISDMHDVWRWAKIQSGAFVDTGAHTSYSVAPLEMHVFRTWPGDFCEEANFGLCRFPKSVRLPDGKVMPTKLPAGWSWSSFCKTQYAADLGMVHFLNCHMFVGAMLDKAARLGLIVEVRDEGDYFDRLDANYRQWSGLLQCMGYKMHDLLSVFTVSEYDSLTTADTTTEEGMLKVMKLLTTKAKEEVSNKKANES